jgi:hypothetical protein
VASSKLVACASLFSAARSAFGHEVAADVALLVARPDHGYLGDRGVADPPLGAVENVLVALTPGGGLQRHRVRAVLGLGQAERADLLEPGHRRKPPGFLLVAAEEIDRPHRKSGMHSEERVDAAVGARQLAGHDPGGQARHPGHP